MCIVSGFQQNAEDTDNLTILPLGPTLLNRDPRFLENYSRIAQGERAREIKPLGARHLRA